MHCMVEVVFAFALSWIFSVGSGPVLNHAGCII